MYVYLGSSIISGLFLFLDSLQVLVFFCQAEAGIRDGHVTGVQTCALPIIAPLPELELAYDIHAFFRIYDDFTDDLTADVGRINVISAELTGILYGRPAKSQMGIIFNDLWTRQIINSPDQWVARVSEHWEWYFNTQATYAAMRDRRLDTTVEEYLELRLGNGAVPLCL